MDSPIKGQSDSFLYKHIELSNGLQALVVHDPTAESACAALDVNVGSFWDPPEYPGLAHFLEHLLFMGSEKYPDEAEYRAFMSEHSGFGDAYTDKENTVFFFSINADFLQPALDRFAQFFIFPLFSTSCVERERNAVNSEFLLHLNNDIWRYSYVQSFLSNNSHPIHKFNIGNAKTLVGRNGTDIRDEVIKFYKKYYSADRMRLVVYGKEPISTLIQYVNDTFCHVPRSLDELDHFGKDIDPTIAENLGSIVWIDTLAFMRQINFTWKIPDQRPLYKSKPAAVLANIIGHDGNGGLLSHLKLKGWAVAVSVGEVNPMTGSADFLISVTLTSQGLLEYASVIEAVFSYLNFLKALKTIPSHLFDEFSMLSRQTFHYSDKLPVHDMAITHASSMHHFPNEEILTGPILVNKYDPDAISTLLQDFLTPGNVTIFILLNYESIQANAANGPSSSCEDQKLFIAFDEKEPWFGTKYHRSKMDVEFVRLLGETLLCGAFYLPEENRFISTDLTIHGNKTTSGSPSVPKEIMKDIWFKQDDSFMLPKGQIMLRITSPHFQSIKQYVSLMLWNAILSDFLLNNLYPAHQAGLNYHLASSNLQYCIMVSGYSEKAFLLLDELLDQVLMQSWAPDATSFSMRKSTYANNLKSTHLDPPIFQANRYLELLLTEVAFGVNQLLATLEGLQLEDINSLETIFPAEEADLRLEALVVGNFKEPDVYRYFDHLPSKFTTANLRIHQDSNPLHAKIVELPHNQAVILGRQVEDPNSCVAIYFQVGALAANVDTAATYVLADMFTSLFFDQLRIREQLGYVVASNIHMQLHTFGLQFNVQSTKDPSFIFARIFSFLEGMVDHIEHQMTDEDIATHVSSVQHAILKKPVNLASEFVTHLTALDAEPKESRFTIYNSLSLVLCNVSRGDLVSFLKEKILDPSTRKMAVIPMFGNASEETLHSFSKGVAQHGGFTPVVLHADDDDLIYKWKMENNTFLSPPY